MLHLNLDKLVQEGKQIFVLNMGNPIGKLMINFDSLGGRRITLSVPKTWIPICVSDQVPLELIRTSVDFKKYLVSGMLQLMDEKRALEMLEDPDAQAAYKDLYASEFANATFETERVKRIKQDLSQTGEQERLIKEKIQIEETNKAEINPRIRDLVMSINSKSVSQTKAKNELRTLKGELKVQDLHYVISECEDQVRAFAKKLLKDIEH